MDSATVARISALARNLETPQEAPADGPARRSKPQRRETGVWTNSSPFLPRERALWQALYSASGGNYTFALKLAPDITLWPRDVLPDESYLKRWGLELDENKATPDPALERLMGQRIAIYKQTKHWLMVDGAIEANRAQTKRMAEGNEGERDGLNSSYTGAVANYGMDKGEHAQKQATTASVRVGNVRITSNHLQAAITPAQAKRAKRIAPPPKMIEAEVKVVE